MSWNILVLEVQPNWFPPKNRCLAVQPGGGRRGGGYEKGLKCKNTKTCIILILYDTHTSALDQWAARLLQVLLVSDFLCWLQKCDLTDLFFSRLESVFGLATNWKHFSRRPRRPASSRKTSTSPPSEPERPSGGSATWWVSPYSWLAGLCWRLQSSNLISGQIASLHKTACI